MIKKLKNNKYKKIYIENSLFMELVDEFATQITEMNFGQETWNVDELEKLDEGYKLTDEAQEYYNEMYDEYEALLNNLVNIYPKK